MGMDNFAISLGQRQVSPFPRDLGSKQKVRDENPKPQKARIYPICMI